MINVYISGASGAVGSKFVEYLLQQKRNVGKIILISSSIVGSERLKSQYKDYTNIDIQMIDKLICNDPNACNVLVNFAFVSSGVPWARIKNNYRLVFKLATFSKENNFRRFVEISSQSVFGFKLTKSVDIDSSFGFFCEEYGLTKRAGEKATFDVLNASDCSFSIVRLGNVLFKNSGPFTQRIFNIYFSNHFKILNQDGYINATLLENTLAGIWFLLSIETMTTESIYHFSEVGEIRWKDIYKILENDFSSYARRVVVREEKERAGLMSLVLRILKSKYSAPFIIFLSYASPVVLNRILETLYRKHRNIGYHLAFRVDSSVKNAFSEKHRFISLFPEGFVFPVNSNDAPKKIAEIYNCDPSI